MAKKRSAPQQRKPQAKNAPDRKSSPEVARLAKLEEVAAQYQGSATPVSASAKFDTVTFMLGCVVAIALAVGGYYYLSSIQIPVSQAFSTSAVRLN